MIEAPRWTIQTPTVPGLYWYALIDSKGQRRNCQVHDFDGTLMTFTDGWVTIKQMHRVWAGPLLAPVGAAMFGDEDT